MIRERWAEPPKVFAVEQRSRLVQIGRNFWECPFVIFETIEDADRVRLGYVCISCLQCHEEPWPEFCDLDTCRFPIRAMQARVFADMWEGEIPVGPSTTLAEEWERAKDEVQRKRHDPHSSIWVPGG